MLKAFQEWVMRKIILTVLLIALAISFANAAGARGNGNTVTIEKKLPPFERIHIGGTAAVNYHLSNEYRVLVTVDSNLEEHLDIVTNDSRLSVRPKQGQRIFPTEFTVDVYSPSLSGVSLSGDVQFMGKDKISARDLSLRISGSGEIDADIICENFSANISGSGRISLSGSCNDLALTISGSGNFEGYDFQSNNADVRVSGSSRIDIWALENLKIRMSGSGWLRYRGNPYIDSSSSGSGYIGRGEYRRNG